MDLDSTITPRQPGHLEVVPNILEESVHANLDRVVISEITRGKSMDSVAVMLVIIAENSNETLKYLRVSEAISLVEAHTVLTPMLINAWNSKSFKEIRNLSAYVIYIHHSILTPSLEILRNDASSSNMLQSIGVPAILSKCRYFKIFPAVTYLYSSTRGR
jgi:hypothetical protein